MIHSSTVILLVSMVLTVSGIFIEISTGKLRGYQSKAKSGKLVNVFKRIPYAAPPVKDLRFQKPHRPQKWDGILNATEYGPACMSNSSITTSKQKWIDEDCLHVNIFAGDDCLKKTCPVVFYIHGGGFNYDSAVMFNDEYLINNFGGNGVVLVIPGMRLGFFGLLNFGDEDVTPANIAAYDLIAALQFVQKDIKPFGGNPDDVTLFGHSQGATTAAQFMFSKEIDPSKKKWNKNNKWSGLKQGHGWVSEFMQEVFDLVDEFLGVVAFFNPFATTLNWRYYGLLCSPDRVIRNTSKAFTEGVVDCLRQVDSFELLRIQREMEDDDRTRTPTGLTMTAPLFKSTNVQSFFLDPSPRPIITGTTSLEFDIDPTDEDLYFGQLTDFLGIKNREEILEQYQKDKQTGNMTFNHSIETQQTFLSSYIIGHQMRKAGGKVYLYSYRNPRRAFHTDDLSYIMGIHLFDYEANDKVLAVIYPQFFIDFIKTGKPRRDWTPLEAELDNYMYIDVDVNNYSMPHMENYYEHDVINYWKNLKELDKRLSEQNQTVATQRAINTPDMDTYTSSLDLLVAFLPVAAVVMAVFVVAYTLRQRKQQKHNRHIIYSEKTPLLF